MIGAIGDREHVARLEPRGHAGRRQGRPDPQALQAGLHADRNGERSVLDDRRRARSAASTSRSSPGRARSRSRDQTLDTADAMRAAGATMLRGGAYKPRTSPYAFQGLGQEGLRLLAEAKERTGLPIVTELMDARDIEAVARGRRRHPDRRAQHAELPAADRGRPLRRARSCIKRGLSRHARGAAHGRRVRPQGGQRERACSASAASARSRPPTASRSTSPRSRCSRSSRTCRSSSTPATPPGRRALVEPLSPGRGRGGRRRHHRRGAPGARGGDLRRPAAAARRRVRRLRRARSSRPPALAGKLPFGAPSAAAAARR